MSIRHVAEALGGAAEGSYDQEAAVVEEGEEMEPEDARGVAKQSDLNELDVPEWELALDKVEWRELLQRISPSRDGGSEPQAERNDWGVGFDWERGDFRRGHNLRNDKVRCAPRCSCRAGLARYRQGVVGG
jgi:hypothetical protein